MQNRTIRALGHTLKHDITNANFISKDVLVKTTTSLVGMPILSGEGYPSRWRDKWWFAAKYFTIGKISQSFAMMAHSNFGMYIFSSIMPVTLFSSFSNYCLRKEDERRRLTGETPRMHDYNSLLTMFTNPKDVGVAVLRTLYGPDATASYSSVIKNSLKTVAGAAVVGAVCYTALPTIMTLAKVPGAAALSTHIPAQIRRPDFLLSLAYTLPTLALSYIGRAQDVYNGHQAVEVINDKIGAANMARVPIRVMPQAETAIKIISQNSGPMEQLIASAIILHDGKIDLMSGQAGDYANRNLLEGANGFCQAIANRNNALVNFINTLPATALANVTPAQIRAVYTSIPATQLTSVTPAQIGANQFSNAHIQAVTPAQISATNITAAQVGAITNVRRDYVGQSITQAQRNAVTTAQLTGAGLANNRNGRNQYVAAVIDSIQAITVASGGANRMALMNTINTNITDVLVAQNDKNVIRDDKDNIDKGRLKALTITIANLIRANPGCANAVNIDEAVKLATKADKEISQSRAR